MTQVVGRNPVQEQAWRDRVLPPVERLDGDIWSVPVPIPDNPLRYTLSYLVPGDSGLVVVDPGWDSDEGWRALVAGLAAAGAGGADVLGIVATHVHPDHHGLSGRLHAVSGAWVAMHPAEAQTLPRRAADGTPRPPGLADAASWLGAVCGAPDDAVDEIMTGFRPPTDPGTGADGPRRDDDMPPGFATMVDPDVLLDDGDLVPLPGRELRALWTPGHTPGHLCLVDRTAGAVLTGDHVLPGITPNISAYPGSAPSMLAQFLASLRAVAVHDDLDVFPAHQYRFRGLAARVDELVEHHEHRCSEILDVVAALGGGPTLWQLAERLSWSRPWDRIGRMRMAALGETAAHVEYLTERGAVVWDRGTGGPGGPPWRVRAAAAVPVD